MKLVTIDAPPTGRVGALLTSGEILDIARVQRTGSIEAWIPRSVREVLAGGQEGLDALRRVVDSAEEDARSARAELRDSGALLAPSTRLLAPVPDPALIVSAGMAYRSHLAEMKTEAPRSPSGFIKVRAAIIGPGAPILLPPQAPEMVDFEGEFSCVIGAACHNASPEEAMACVAGYTLINDVSARDWVAAALGPKDPQAAAAGWRLNHLGKQFPTFCPMGPVLATRDEIGDPHAVRLTTRLNGAVMQSASTADLIFSIGETIAYFSRWYRFVPGDIVTTGSPAGVGYARNPRVFMKDGDTISVEVAAIGALTNPIRRASG